MESLLGEQVEAYLHPQPGSRQSLHFPAELNARFELDRLEQRSRQVLLTGIVAMVFFDLFLFADYAKHPGVIWRCVVLRLGVVTPIILLTTWFVRKRVRAAVREALVLASVTIAGAVVLAVSYDVNRIDSIFSQTGFILIVFFGSLILRQQFAYGVATLLLMLVEDAVYLGADRWMTTDDRVTAVFMVVTCMILTQMANFMMERQERTSFALSLKEGFHSKALLRLNQKLTALSQVDGLTGLSNRRHFEERYREMWQEAAGAGEALSLLMIDIDHFKRLNDTFGHIAGDRVLIQMGQILAASVRASDDLVARFGGEEFIILLVGADHETAHQVADDLRILVYTSPVMPLDSDPGGSVTISCGLATSFPAEGTAGDDNDRLKLIGEADLALYAAKCAGRNRVACRHCEALPLEKRWRHPAGADHGGLKVPSHNIPVDYSMPSFLQS